MPGLAQILLNISLNSSLGVPPEIMLAAAIQLKNLLKDCWSLLPGYQSEEILEKPILLESADKNFIRENLLRSICHSQTKAITKQLEQCFYHVADREFPDGWTFFTAQIKEGLNTAKTPDQFKPILYAFASLAKIFKYKEEKLQKNVIPAMDEIFSGLQKLALELIKNQENINDNPSLLRTMASAYYHYTSFVASPEISNEISFNSWMNIFQSIYNWKIPVELTNPISDPEEIKSRSKLPVFKMQSAVCEILGQIFHKYGNPDNKCKNYEDFAKLIQTKYTRLIFNIHVLLIQNSLSRFFSHSQIINAYSILRSSLYNPLTINLLKPLIPDLLAKITFENLLLTPDIANLWETDQLEFLQEFLEDLEMDATVRSISVVFIQEVCSYKGFDTGKKKKRVSHEILNNFLAFLSGKLTESVQNGNVRIYEAALYCIGKLRKTIKKYLPLIEQMESLIQNFAFPCMDSPIGILRMRACWLIAKYANIKYNNEELLLSICNKLVNCMKDKYLAVQVMSAIAISKLCEKPSVEKALKPHSTTLVSGFLALMGQAELNKLVTGLERLINCFAEAIIPYSAELITELFNSFKRMNEHSSEEDKQMENDFEMPESGSAAIGCLQTISNILDIIKNNPEALNKIEPIILSIINLSMAPQEMYILENGIELLLKLTAYTPKISPEIWKFYEPLMDICVGTPKESSEKKNVKKNGNWGYDNIRDITVIMQNYIAKDFDTFYNGKNTRGQKYLDLMFHFMARIFEISHEQKTEFDRIPAIWLCNAIIENGQDKIYDLFQKLCEKIINEAGSSEIQMYHTVTLQAVCVCLHFSIQQTFIILETLKLTNKIFEDIFKFTMDLPQDHLGRTLIALIDILSNPSKIPVILQNEIMNIFKFAVKLCGVLSGETPVPKKNKKNSEEILENNEENDENFENIEDENFEDEDDDNFGMGDIRPHNLNLNKYYASPYKKIHPIYYAYVKLAEIKAKDNTYYQRLENSLSETEKMLLQKSLNRAENLQNEININK